MAEKIFAMKCKNDNCDAIIVYLGEFEPGVFGVISDPDYKNRSKQVGDQFHIICPVCNKTNVLVSTTENNLPVLKLTKILEE